MFFRVLGSLVVFTMSSHSLFKSFFFLQISLYDYFGYGFKINFLQFL